jgi:hypothetical protein
MFVPLSRIGTTIEDSSFMRTIFSRDTTRNTLAATLIGCLVCTLFSGCGGSDQEMVELARASAAESPLSGPGSLDPSFGKSGTVRSDIVPMGADNLALQPDGKIVVVTPPRSPSPVTSATRVRVTRRPRLAGQSRDAQRLPGVGSSLRVGAVDVLASRTGQASLK